MFYGEKFSLIRGYILAINAISHHTISGSAISEASRPAEKKHAVRSKYDEKKTEKRGPYPLLSLRSGACLLNFGDRTRTGVFRRLIRAVSV